MTAQRRPNLFSQFSTTGDLDSPLFLIQFQSCCPSVIDLSAARDDSASWDKFHQPSTPLKKHQHRCLSHGSSNIYLIFSSFSEFGSAMLINSEVPPAAFSSPDQFPIKRKRTRADLVVSPFSRSNEIVIEYHKKILSPFCFRTKSPHENFDPVPLNFLLFVLMTLNPLGVLEKNKKLFHLLLLTFFWHRMTRKKKRKRCSYLPNKGFGPSISWCLGSSGFLQDNKNIKIKGNNHGSFSHSMNTGCFSGRKRPISYGEFDLVSDGKLSKKKYKIDNSIPQTLQALQETLSSFV